MQVWIPIPKYLGRFWYIIFCLIVKLNVIIVISNLQEAV